MIVKECSTALESLLTGISKEGGSAAFLSSSIPLNIFMKLINSINELLELGSGYEEAGEIYYELQDAIRSGANRVVLTDDAKELLILEKTTFTLTLTVLTLKEF